MEYFSRAAAGILVAVPQVGRREGCVDRLAALRQNLLRRRRDDQPAPIQFSVHVRIAVGVHCNPIAGQHVQPVIDRPVPPPVTGDGKGIDHVYVAAKLAEVLPLEDVPVAVQQRAPVPLAQVLQPRHIFRVGAHEKAVVLYL